MTHIEFLSSSTPAPNLPAQGGAEGSSTIASGGDSKVIAVLVGKAAKFVIPHKLGTQAYSVTIQKEAKNGFKEEAKAVTEGVSYYRLDKTTEAKDEIGTNTGAKEGTIATAAGALNPADTNLSNEFTKVVGQFWKISPAASLEAFGAKFTFLGFVYPTIASMTGGIFTTTVGDVQGSAQEILIENGKLKMNLKGAATTKSVNGTVLFPAEQWTFFAGTFDEAVGMKIYQATLGTASIKKEGETAMVEASKPGTGNANIGRLGGGIFPMNGRIDELVLYKKTLSEAEIEKVYKSALSVPGGPGEIIPSWTAAGEKIKAIPLNLNELEIVFEKEPGAKENVWVTIEG